MFNRWKSFILSRFADRQDVGKREAYRRFWSDSPEQSVMEFFKEIEAFYLLPAGLLRPEDDVKKLVEPDKPDKWYKPTRYEVRFDSLESEIYNQLSRRQELYGTSCDIEKIHKIDDLIRIWCGELPRNYKGIFQPELVPPYRANIRVNG